MMTKEQEQAIHDIARGAKAERPKRKPYEVKIYKENGSSHTTTMWAAHSKEIIKKLEKEYNIGRGAGCRIRELSEA